MSTQPVEMPTLQVDRKPTLAWRLAPVLTLTAAALGWIGWQFWVLQKEAAHFRTHDFRLVQLSGEILHLDEVLTMSARMSAATLDPHWEARYQENDPKLDDIINETSMLDPADMGDFITQTDAANHKLEVMESNAFALVHKKDGAGASAILTSPDYTQQKQIYADGMVKLNDAILAHANSAMEERRTDVLISLGTLAGVLVAFVLFWIALWKSGGQKTNAAK